MSLRKQLFLLVAGLALIGGVLYLASATRWRARAELDQLAGLAGLPAESGLVAGVDLAELRRQQWLVEMTRRASGEVQEAPDYRAFVEATGFDYTRDLDHLWLGVLGSQQQPLLTAIAEGRFARDKIIAFARQQGAILHSYQGVDIYHVEPPAAPASPPSPSEPPPRGFAFAFLDATHLAVASDVERLGMVIDCWLGRAPAVTAEELRGAEFERLATGQQAWGVVDLTKWEPPIAPPQQNEPPLESLMSQVSLGLRASPQGLDLSGEARCHEPAQAQRLRDNLSIMVQLGQWALARDPSENAQAVAQLLNTLTITQEGNTVQARLLVPAATLDTLLRAQPPSKTSP